jgi:hypothetical protein
MGLVAVIASLHRWTVGSRRESVVLNVEMTIGTESSFFDMEFMGDLHNPNVLQIGLFSPRNGGVTAKTVLVQQIITGGIILRDELSRLGVAVHTSD